MHLREAQDLIRMVESNWHFDLGTARGMWRDELVMWDAAVATKAIALLGRKANYKIRLADVVETMDMLKRKEREKVEEERKRVADERGLKEGRRGYATPEWVWVWGWCRNYREPREWRDFPQMGDYASPLNSLTMEEYEALREEWATAGSPKEKADVNLVRAL